MPSHSHSSRREFFTTGLIVFGMGVGAKMAWEHRKDLVRYWSPNEKRQPVLLPSERDYAEFLGKLDLRYISPREIIVAHRREREGVKNTLPPRELWRGILPTLKVADEIRARLGCKLRRITSAYRSPRYNAMCPGAAPHSYHTKNRALDLVYDCPPTEAWEAADALRKERYFQGGLGLYSSFIHVDTRGRNATWGV